MTTENTTKNVARNLSSEGVKEDKTNRRGGGKSHKILLLPP